MDENPYEAPREQPDVDPELGTQRQPTIGSRGDRFVTRAALAVIVLFWVGSLVAVLLWFMWE